MAGVSIWQLLILLVPGAGVTVQVQAFVSAMPMSVLGMAALFQ